MEFNLVDLIIVLCLVAYVASHVRYGVVPMLEKLLSFVGSLILAFLSYPWVSGLIKANYTFPPGITDAFTFLGLFLLFQIGIHLLLSTIFNALPLEERLSRLSKILAVVPAAIDGLILISLTLLLLVVAPVLPAVKAPIEDSVLGGQLVDKAAGIEIYVDKVFGKAAQESLGFLTLKPSETGAIYLPYSPKNLSVSPELEREMLALLNAERKKEGLKPLVMDSALTAVAREHSRDMWENNYFSHINLEGETPFDRMDQAGINFETAGENLALARTVERAHDGLMHSEGHRRNIMDPAFGRVGIGAIDGGIYGIMFTQNFTN